MNGCPCVQAVCPVVKEVSTRKIRPCVQAYSSVSNNSEAGGSQEADRWVVPVYKYQDLMIYLR
jgi:hypothetical protein